MTDAKKKRILLIEDDRDISRTIQIQLNMEGFDVITAADGYEGIYKARKETPDLLILDLKLPGLPGEEICRDLRKERSCAGLPIIMLTAKDTDTDRVIGKVIGADDYMRKPFDMDALLGRIRALLGNA